MAFFCHCGKFRCVITRSQEAVVISKDNVGSVFQTDRARPIRRMSPTFNPTRNDLEVKYSYAWVDP